MEGHRLVEQSDVTRCCSPTASMVDRATHSRLVGGDAELAGERRRHARHRLLHVAARRAAEDSPAAGWDSQQSTVGPVTVRVVVTAVTTYTSRRRDAAAEGGRSEGLARVPRSTSLRLAASGLSSGSCGIGCSRWAVTISKSEVPRTAPARSAWPRAGSRASRRRRRHPAPRRCQLGAMCWACRRSRARCGSPRPRPAGDAEVGQVGGEPAVGAPTQQHVGRLDVAVHEAGRVRIGETVGDLLHQVDRDGHRRGAVRRQHRAQVPSGTSWVAIQSRPSSSPWA